MLNITDSPFNLVKWYIQHTLLQTNVVILRTKSLQELRDCLMESVCYDTEGELIPSFYLIYYDGLTIPKEIRLSSYITVYLVITDSSKWKHLISNSIKFFNIKPSQYQDIINCLSAVMNSDTLSYFWSQYCIKEFACNPYKWYNESKRLLALFATQERLFSKEDLNCLYGKVSDTVRPYLSNIFTNNSRKYIRQMTNTEMFIIFIGTEHKKALILYYLTKLKEEFLPTYMIFRQAFLDGTIRLNEGVFILDYLLNKNTQTNIKEIKNLFGVN